MNTDICPLCESGQHGHDLVLKVFKCECLCHAVNVEAVLREVEKVKVYATNN